MKLIMIFKVKPKKDNSLHQYKDMNLMNKNSINLTKIHT
jgi:hypothetical protein